MSVCHMEYVPHEATNLSTNASEDYYYLDYEEDVLRSHFHVEKEVSLAIVRYVWPLIIVAGTVGNILSFLVLIRRRMRRTPVYFYLAMLACADTLVLYLSGFKTWLRVITGFELLHLSNATCKAFMFMFLQSLHLSAFFIVAVTLDRFLTVMFPFNKSIFGNLRHTKSASLLAFVFIMFYNCHVFWTISLQKYSDGWVTCSPSSRTFFMCEVYPWLKLALYTIVPFFLVLVFNLFIVLKMYQAHNQFNSDVDSSTNRYRNGQYRITVMLLGVSMTWLVLTAPFALYNFIYNAGESQNGADEAQIFLFKTICFTLLYINHGINFYLYCVSGKRFRKELNDIIRSVRRWSLYSRKTSSYHVKVISNRDDGVPTAQRFLLRTQRSKEGEAV